MDHVPFPIEQILNSCQEQIIWLEQFNTSGFIEIQCCLIKGKHTAKCKYGYFQDFQFAPNDLANWKTPLLSRRSEILETRDQVLKTLNSALFETCHQQQGYANILIRYHRRTGQYGLQFCPSIRY
ncbi:MAG: hypothetical protein RM368_33200 [Nostoc sp. DedSLP03]|uniref:hypothetical protein n=1 Tax=Nostoc sp. DedSLP03 TaxID=3075400 RepID=UPI002AD4F344|nr:hypothetical protein [Nostoc sp. DedSLP03]MDZ7969749.1 hypothetical protein [Nostoc sp. DedSLP03]